MTSTTWRWRASLSLAGALNVSFEAAERMIAHVERAARLASTDLRSEPADLPHQFRPLKQLMPVARVDHER